MATVRGGMIRLDPSRGSSLTLIVASPPDRSGGVGGWQATSRPGRRPGKWWQDQPDDVMSIECILDVNAINGPSVEQRLKVLYAMGKRGTEVEPPTLRILGDVDPEDRRLTWVLQDIAKGARLYQGDGTLRRQTVTLSLEGYAELGSIQPVRIKRTRTSTRKRRQRAYTVHKGDTLRSIAVQQLGYSSGWKDIASWNKPFAGIDPDAPLRAGTRITLK